MLKTLQKKNVFEGFFVYMFELASGVGTWQNMFELAKKACGVGGPSTRSGVNINQHLNFRLEGLSAQSDRPEGLPVITSR